MARNRVSESVAETPSEMLGEQSAIATAEPPRPGRSRMTPEEREARKAALAMESKDAKFVRLARKRGIKAVKALRQLQHLANRSQYEWTPEQAANIVKNLEQEIAAIKGKFAGNKTNGVTFSL